jgi:hypothetical protein
LSALDDADQHYDDGNNEQDVNESSQRVGGDHSQGPQDQQNEKNGPQHDDFLSLKKWLRKNRIAIQRWHSGRETKKAPGHAVRAAGAAIAK